LRHVGARSALRRGPQGTASRGCLASWQGEFTDEYFAQPAPDPVAFGMPTEDDGSRDDPLLSTRIVPPRTRPPPTPLPGAAGDHQRQPQAQVF
jgi:hypothetical protein